MEAIYEAGGTLDFALTLRDELAPKKAGRAYIDAFCAQHDIELRKFDNVNDDDALQSIVRAELDWLFIVGWSQIARPAVLRSTRLGVLGMHPTLLPTGRGRAAIPWAILLGLAETGVTLFKMDEGVDTGPIIAQTKVRIDAAETAATLYPKIATAHAALLKDNWRALMAGQLLPVAQDDRRATVWKGRRPEDGLLTSAFTTLDADRLIRAVTRPYPGAFIHAADGLMRIWACGAPGQDCGGAAPASGVRRLHFCDGWLDAIDWQHEVSPSPECLVGEAAQFRPLSQA
ncbi:MAG: formyltransferase family protein [Steroidobacteraceae bacterium]